MENTLKKENIIDLNGKGGKRKICVWCQRLLDECRHKTKDFQNIFENFDYELIDSQKGPVTKVNLISSLTITKHLAWDQKLEGNVFLCFSDFRLAAFADNHKSKTNLLSSFYQQGSVHFPANLSKRISSLQKFLCSFLSISRLFYAFLFKQILSFISYQTIFSTEITIHFDRIFHFHVWCRRCVVSRNDFLIDLNLHFYYLARTINKQIIL